MQKLSLREFKDFYSNQSNPHIIFDSVNQNWTTTKDTMCIKAVFDNIKINFTPNTICLYSSNFNTIQFSRVKYIEMDEPSMLGFVFNIICGDKLTINDDKCYTLIIS